MTNINSLYKVEVYDSSGTLIADLTGKYRSLNFSITRNRPETITLTFDLMILEDFARGLGQDIRTLFNVNRNEIRIKRGDNYLVAGQINATAGDANVADKTLEVRAVGWLALFKDRYTDSSEVFSSTDAGAIAWSLINTSQSLTNGNFGITQGTNENDTNSGPHRDRTYEYKNVMDAIIQLSEVINGFDFEFTYNKIFNVYYPRQSKRTTPIEFEYPRNILSLSIEEDGVNMVNKAICRGQGFGSEQLVETRNNTACQTTFKLREKVLDFSDVKEATTLQEHGDEELRVFAMPILIPQITLMPNLDNSQPVIKKDFWIDDDFIIRCVESDYMKRVLNNVYRIESINVRVDENGLESITINQGSKDIGSEQDIPEQVEKSQKTATKKKSKKKKATVKKRKKLPRQKK